MSLRLLRDSQATTRFKVSGLDVPCHRESIRFVVFLGVVKEIEFVICSGGTKLDYRGLRRRICVVRGTEICCASFQTGLNRNLPAGLGHLVGGTKVDRVSVRGGFITVGVRFKRVKGVDCLHPGCTGTITSIIGRLKKGPFLASYGALCPNDEGGTLRRLCYT